MVDGFSRRWPQRADDLLLLQRLLDDFHDARFPHALAVAWPMHDQGGGNNAGDVVFGTVGDVLPVTRIGVNYGQGQAGGEVRASEVLLVEIKSLSRAASAGDRDGARAALLHRLDFAARQWRRLHPGNTVFGTPFLNDRHFSGFVRAYEYGGEADRLPTSRATTRTIMVGLPELPLDMVAPTQRIGAATPALPPAAAPAAAAADGVFQLPTIESVKQLAGNETVIAYFGCGRCNLFWARRVPTTRPISSCRKCHTKLKRIPLEAEPPGLGFFKCPECHRQWTSNPAARNVPQPCYGCTRAAVHPDRVIPSHLLREQDGPRREKTDNRHRCAHCTLVPPRNGERCPLAARPNVPSQVSDSHSVQSSILSGPSIQFYRPDNIDRIRARFSDRYGRGHAREPLDGDP